MPVLTDSAIEDAMYCSQPHKCTLGNVIPLGEQSHFLHYNHHTHLEAFKIKREAQHNSQIPY